MPDLQALQDQMAAAILSGDMAPVADAFSHPDRLTIFRNNTFASLTQALKTTFPVTVQLSDERFFAYAAHEFIAGEPPREARLSEYGAGFARFLVKFVPCQDHPILAAMASFEWALASSLNNAEAPPASVAAIEQLTGKASLVLQPHLRLTLSRWPVLQLWTEHKRADPPVPAPLMRKIERVAIIRHGEDLQFLPLDAGRFAFWHALARGLSLDAAANRAFTRAPSFDLSSEILLLFRLRIVTRVVVPTYH
jgi:hypothetical protein